MVQEFGEVRVGLVCRRPIVGDRGRTGDETADGGSKMGGPSWKMPIGEELGGERGAGAIRKASREGGRGGGE